MYAWINDELWSADGRPELHDRHGWLVGPDYVQRYGRLLDDAESQVVSLALYAWRHPAEPQLPIEPGRFTGDGAEQLELEL